MKFKLMLPTLISLIAIVGCNNRKRDEAKFDKVLWDSVGDLKSHPTREIILEDLIKNHKIIGLTCRQLIDSLGQPENYGDTKDSIYYDIVVNYGYLDPKSGTYLAVGFNKDSLITGFKVVEWKNRHANE